VAAEVYSITLTAGKSSRMPEDMRCKACCKVGALSTIDNALKTYELAGISKHVIVVGHAAEEVMEEVTRKRRDVLFAYQSRPRGTGDAVECAMALLEGVGPPESVVICAGDKVIAPYVVRGLLETYGDYGCDLCLVGGPAESYPYAGRVVERGGLVMGIVEVPDIKVRQLAAELRGLKEDRRPATIGELTELTRKFFPNQEKLARCFPAIRELLFEAPEEPVAWEKVLAAARTVPDGFDLPCGHVTTEEAASCPLANVQPYAARFTALREALKKVRTENVQGERYFTDVAAILAGEGRQVRLFRIGHPEHVMAFNNLPELEAVRRVHAQRSLSAVRYPTLAQWSNYLAQHAEMALPGRAVEKLAETVGAEREAIVARSPGRINLMGRHVDHQGGTCNLMAIDREIVMAASPREDDRINLWNADERNYPHRSFTVSELTGDMVWEDWLRTLNTQFVQRLVSASTGDWATYVKGAVLRLQHRFPHQKLRGMDAYVCGNIPVAAGLSSSSALLVATAEAMIELNGLNIRLREFVDLCGEGEWFAGTRGGSADHAAIKYGREREVVSVSFFPFRTLAHHPFPAECSLIVCHSGQFAKKTETARARFNARISCYHMAREFIRRRFPDFAPKIAHLRDVNTRNLEISLPALYKLLKLLPNAMTPDEVRAMAAEHATVAKCLADVQVENYAFPLRDMALYGLAECERSAMAGELLDRRELARFGEMMRISHDGDRVAQWRPERAPFDSSVSEEQMEALSRRAASLESLVASGAALWRQPGAYDCSTPEIDLMADTVADVPGVIGAQLSGDGLGGCIMVLAKEDATDAVRETLSQRYYEPRKIEPRMFVCRPARGSHVLTATESE